MNFKHLFLLLFLISNFPVPNNGKIYNSLSFELSPVYDNFWRIVGNENLIERLIGITTIATNTIDYVDGKQSWIITCKNKDFHTSVYTYFNLPQKSNTFQVSIFAKTRNLHKAWLKVYCLDIDENRIGKDSVSLINQEDWKEFTVRLTAKKTERIYIEIEAESNNAAQYNIKEKPYLMIDQCEIVVDGKVLDSVPNGIDTKTRKVKNLINLDSITFEGIESVNELKNHRIVALGESVHGSDEIQHYSFEIIKHLIKNEDCRLVLFELNFELGLWLNEFISDKANEIEIEKRLKLYNYSYLHFADLLLWIRDFNKSSAEKVRICGIDQNLGFEQFNQSDNLLDFIQCQPIKNDSLNSLLKLIKNRKYGKALDLISRENLLVDIDGNTKIGITKAIELRKKESNYGTYLPEEYREIIQFNNSKFAIDNWLPKSAKVVIYAHLGHVNKQNSISGRVNFESFGNLMYRQYSDDYFVIAFLLGTGTITSSVNKAGSTSNYKLSSPVEGSLEKQLMNSKSSFYYVLIKNLEQAYYLRLIGFQFTENQFYPSSFRNKFDAVIFIRNSK